MFAYDAQKYYFPDTDNNRQAKFPLGMHARMNFVCRSSQRPDVCTSKRIMMKFYFLRRMAAPAVLVCCLALGSCSSGWTEEDEQFVQTYTEILIVRERVPDTAVANPQVRDIIRNNGYTWESFQQEFADYTQEAEKFRRMLDSARNRAQRIVEQDTATGQPR